MLDTRRSPLSTPSRVLLPPIASTDSPNWRRERVLAWIRSDPELPTPPAIALRVIDRASDPDCEPAEMADIIGQDPAICAKVLRTVNSAVYGLRSPITSIPSAVRFLGIHPLRSLVLAFSLSNLRWAPLPRKVHQNHWRVSVAGALAARQLASLARRPNPDNDLVAGLVRDLGVFVLYQLFPEEYRTVYESTPEALSAFQCELEEEAIGLNHAEVGAELLARWRMPEDITESVRHHHDLERASQLIGHRRDGARLLYLASQVGQLQLTPNRPLLLREVYVLAKEECHLDERPVQQLLESLRAQINEFAGTLEVDVGDSIDLSAVVSRGVGEFARLAVTGSGKFPSVAHLVEPSATCAMRTGSHAPKAPAATVVPSHGEIEGDALQELQWRLFPGPRTPGQPLGQLDGYEVTDVLGCGAMGAVFRAFDPRLERVVAIKAMLPHRAGDGLSLSRFFQEGRAVANLTHDNIVKVYSVGEAAGIPYLVMEYVEGTNIEQKLDAEAPLPLSELLRLGLDAASGLSAAHAKGLVHRDIKPANLLLHKATGKLKIADFGLVQGYGKADTSQAGQLVGTPHFMSPEQAEGQRPDARSDMFSLGSVLYLACTGRLPFPGGSLMAVLRAIWETTPPPLRLINPDLPAWMEELVAGLLTKEPARRFPTAAELRRLLLSRWARFYTGSNGERSGR